MDFHNFRNFQRKRRSTEEEWTVQKLPEPPGPPTHPEGQFQLWSLNFNCIDTGSLWGKLFLYLLLTTHL